MNLAVGFWIAAEGPGLFRALRSSRRANTEVAGRRLARLLAAAQDVPLYSTLLSGRSDHLTRAPFQMLETLPPATKELLRQAESRVFRGGSIDPSWHSTRSSGSTGEPFRTYYDSRSWAILKYLVKARARWSCGVRPGHRVAIVDTPSDSGAAAGPVRSRSVRRVNALQPAEAIAAELAALRPEVVYGLPSTLLEAATAAPGTVRARLVFTSGELLTPEMRTRLQDAYQGRVHDVYGCTETKEIAWECRNGRLHVNSDVLHLEILDDAGHSASAGEEGRITVTVLVNSAMPLLRYQPGDRGMLAEGGCECGLAFPVLGVVTGREVEYLDLGNGRRVSPYQLTCAIERVPGIGRFQVVQRERRLLLVRAQPLPGVDRAAIVPGLKEAVAAAIPVGVTVEVLLESHLGREEESKFQVVRPLSATTGGKVP